MRPLDKGATPTDSHGNPIVVTEYKNWRKSLVDRIGYYCAYCNQPLSHSLQVEHVNPKIPPAGHAAGAMLAWDNMLLACGPCNNAKGNTPVDATTYYLPEEHNTHLPFVIQISNKPDHAQVIAKAGLNGNQTHKANETIELLRLAEIDEREGIVDLRSKKRKDALTSVHALRLMFDQVRLSPTFDMPSVAEWITLQAKATGFFSLWYEEFHNVPEIMQRLTDNSLIMGTAVNCFDPANGYQPINRNPGAVDPI